MPAISSFAQFNVLAVCSGVGCFCVMFESMMQVRGAKCWQSTNGAYWKWKSSGCLSMACHKRGYTPQPALGRVAGCAYVLRLFYAELLAGTDLGG